MGSETPYKFGYCTIVATGAQRIDGPGLQHLETMKYLLDRGTPPDEPDIVGITAIQHIAIGQTPVPALLRMLLQRGANPNHQNRYGEAALHQAFQIGHPETIDILLEFGADLDVEDADDFPARSMYLQSGPTIPAIVHKWMNKRAGTSAPMQERACDACRKPSDKLKLCGKCKLARYCSVDCQSKLSLSPSSPLLTIKISAESHWRNHKPNCQPFSETTTVTLKPYYDQSGTNMFSTGDFARSAMGIASQPRPETHNRRAHVPKNLDKTTGKSLIVKVQIPFMPGSPPPVAARISGHLMIYTKKVSAHFS